MVLATFLVSWVATLLLTVLMNVSVAQCKPVTVDLWCRPNVFVARVCRLGQGDMKVQHEPAFLTAAPQPHLTVGSMSAGSAHSMLLVRHKHPELAARQPPNYRQENLETVERQPGLGIKPLNVIMLC